MLQRQLKKRENKKMELEDFNIEEYKKKTLAELKRPMFIEASAGTGKTYTITKIIKSL